MATARKTANTPVRKTAPRKAARPTPVAPKAASPLPAKAAAAGTGKAEKARKPKLVRDSFTIPKNEYAVLDGLKQRAAAAGRPARKSEILRAGIKALAAMSNVAFLAAVGAVPAIKTGRPAKS